MLLFSRNGSIYPGEWSLFSRMCQLKNHPIRVSLRGAREREREINPVLIFHLFNFGDLIQLSIGKVIFTFITHYKIYIIAWNHKFQLKTFNPYYCLISKLLFFCLNITKIVFPDQYFFKLTATLLTWQAGQGCCGSAQVVGRQNGFSGSSLGVEMVTWKKRKSKE